MVTRNPDARHFLIFSAPRCASCPPVIKMVQHAADAHGLNCEIVDAQAHPRRAKAFEVQSAPAVFLLNGHTVLRSGGRVSAKTLETWLLETR
jgi:thioredoxin-like negative regulator of GroEL